MAVPNFSTGGEAPSLSGLINLVADLQASNFPLSPKYAHQRPFVAKLLRDTIWKNILKDSLRIEGSNQADSKLNVSKSSGRNKSLKRNAASSHLIDDQRLQQSVHLGIISAKTGFKLANEDVLANAVELLPELFKECKVTQGGPPGKLLPLTEHARIIWFLLLLSGKNGGQTDEEFNAIHNERAVPQHRKRYTDITLDLLNLAGLIKPHMITTQMKTGIDKLIGKSRSPAVLRRPGLPHGIRYNNTMITEQHIYYDWSAVESSNSVQRKTFEFSRKWRANNLNKLQDSKKRREEEPTVHKGLMKPEFDTSRMFITPISSVPFHPIGTEAFFDGLLLSMFPSEKNRATSWMSAAEGFGSNVGSPTSRQSIADDSWEPVTSFFPEISDSSQIDYNNTVEKLIETEENATETNFTEGKFKAGSPSNTEAYSMVKFVSFNDFSQEPLMTATLADVFAAKVEEDLQAHDINISKVKTESAKEVRNSATGLTFRVTKELADPYLADEVPKEYGDIIEVTQINALRTNVGVAPLPVAPINSFGRAIKILSWDTEIVRSCVQQLQSLQSTPPPSNTAFERFHHLPDKSYSLLGSACTTLTALTCGGLSARISKYTRLIYNVEVNKKNSAVWRHPSDYHIARESPQSFMEEWLYCSLLALQGTESSLYCSIEMQRGLSSGLKEKKNELFGMPVTELIGRVVQAMSEGVQHTTWHSNKGLHYEVDGMDFVHITKEKCAFTDPLSDWVDIVYNPQANEREFAAERGAAHQPLMGSWHYRKFARLGSIVRRLQAFTFYFLYQGESDVFSKNDSGSCGLILKAFCEGLRKFLNAYFTHVSTLLEKCQLLKCKIESPLELWLYAEKWNHPLHYLAAVCKLFPNFNYVDKEFNSYRKASSHTHQELQQKVWVFPRGIKLLDYLYEHCTLLESQVPVAKRSAESMNIQEILRQLFTASLQPFSKFLEDWIFKGNASTISPEFLSFTLKTQSSGDYPLVSGALKKLITKNILDEATDLFSSNSNGFVRPAFNVPSFLMSVVAELHKCTYLLVLLHGSGTGEYLTTAFCEEPPPIHLIESTLNAEIKEEKPNPALWRPTGLFGSAFVDMQHFHALAGAAFDVDNENMQLLPLLGSDGMKALLDAPTNTSKVGNGVNVTTKEARLLLRFSASKNIVKKCDREYGERYKSCCRGLISLYEAKGNKGDRDTIDQDLIERMKKAIDVVSDAAEPKSESLNGVDAMAGESNSVEGKYAQDSLRMPFLERDGSKHEKMKTTQEAAVDETGSVQVVFLKEAIERCLIKPIKLQYYIANVASAAVIKQHFKLLTFMELIKKFVLYGASDVMSSFIRSLMESRWIPDVAAMSDKLSKLFASKVESSPLWREFLPDCTTSGSIHTGIGRMFKLSVDNVKIASSFFHPTARMDSVKLEINAPFPINLFIDEQAKHCYSAIFQFLSIVKYTEYDLQMIWTELWKQKNCFNLLCKNEQLSELLDASEGGTELADSFSLLKTGSDAALKNWELFKFEFEKDCATANKIRSELQFMFDTVHEYIMCEAIQTSWERTMKGIAEAETLEAMIRCHATHLNRTYRKCFLSENLAAVNEIILKVFNQIHLLRRRLEDTPMPAIESLEFEYTAGEAFDIECDRYIMYLEGNPLLKVWQTFVENRRKFSIIIRKLEGVELFQGLKLRLDYNGYYIRQDMKAGL